MTAPWRLALFASGTFALLAGATPRPALGDDHDQSKEDWTGEQFVMQKQGAAPVATPATPTTTPTPPPPPPAGAGTPTQPVTPTGTSTDPGTTGVEQPPGLAPTYGDPLQPDPTLAGGAGGGGGTSPLPPLAPAVPTCSAHWDVMLKKPNPELYLKQTFLTLTLFRNDSFAFVSNAYAKSWSTWYLDWFVSTHAQHNDSRSMEVTMTLVGGCSNCAPRITVSGIGLTDARAVITCSLGNVDGSSYALAAATASWSAPVSINVRSAAAAAGSPGALQGSLDTRDGWKIAASNSATSQVVKFDPQSLGAQATVPFGYVKVIIRNGFEIAADASGHSDTCQAKALVGYDLDLTGVTTHGTLKTYKVTKVKS